jgi:hypothetical protein
MSILAVNIDFLRPANAEAAFVIAGALGVPLEPTHQQHLLL